ncbi:7TM-DISM domain-containing protein [Williamsia sp. CHRR-6]|uniref:7TM-DISM domain-containing protein n=1 Tax=Williamsia sp. CHRR-6 TaxID=2835871 RepID=UPI001BD9E739|nr:7TM-DISM domain-containing protein [Williamsia sp. CHRR-6]MBT0565976.1 hypothetical protein [Williamsia sp. CHRR-6]
MSTPQPWSTPSGPPEPERTKPTLATAMAIATELWLVVILGQAVAYLGQYSTLADSVRRSAREATTQAERDLGSNTAFIIAIYIAGALVLTVISLFLVWLARNGYQWARLTLTFISAFLVIQTVFALFDSVGPRWVTVPSVLSGVAALGAAYLLAQKECETYCTEMAAYRQARRPFAGSGSGPGGPYPPAPYPGSPYPPQQYPAPPYPRQSYPAPPYPPQSYPPQSYPPQSYPLAPSAEQAAPAADLPSSSLMEPDSPMPESPPAPWNGGTNQTGDPESDAGPTGSVEATGSSDSAEPGPTEARPSLAKAESGTVDPGTSDGRARGENVRERAVRDVAVGEVDEETTG